MSNVNYIAHLNGYFARVEADARLNSSHLGLYMALFQLWNMNRFRNPISVARQELMHLSKIGSTNTYTRCMRELHEWDYIDYHPSHNPLKGSTVNMFYFGYSKPKPTQNSSYNTVKKPINKGVNEDKDYSEPL